MIKRNEHLLTSSDDLEVVSIFSIQAILQLDIVLDIVSVGSPAHEMILSGYAFAQLFGIFCPEDVKPSFGVLLI